ncbi:hypothetical protein KHA96_10680 [Bacillus sp. FJAT-49711]|uniref:hypothetical protein n=1 Tax=Bacillus sp. FJAT-49711 TaxID=2833585 RepID=UPI001BCA5B4D|nr:hypothetical protein [Bacillus sp. FJAT-49711]MBS4218778.1 hypothetical protein [Bacillus sp. FJAT-49711]
MKNILSYLFIKLAGAGFSFSIFNLFIMLDASKFDMYQFSKDLSSPLYWAAFFGYGCICSIAIDLIINKVPNIGHSRKVILYLVAGFSIFFVFGFNFFTIIAGAIGALAALLFYFGSSIASKTSVFKYIFAFAMPILFLTIMSIDFTEKEQWLETKKDTSYFASFSLFNGEQQIPIKASEGQTVAATITINNENGGGHGQHILNEKGKLIPMYESTEKQIKFKAEKSGIYRIVITGDDLKGSFSVDWKLEDL